MTDIFIYNNTVVNQRDSYLVSGQNTHVHFPMHANTVTVARAYNYNNLYYNSNAGTSSARFSGNGYHASGGHLKPGGTNEQTGLESSIFTNYKQNSFGLAERTDAGLILSKEPWWNDKPAAFFEYLDSEEDMYGNVRGADGHWDRGAFQYGSYSETVRPTEPSAVSSPTGLTIIN